MRGHFEHLYNVGIVVYLVIFHNLQGSRAVAVFYPAWHTALLVFVAYHAANPYGTVKFTVQVLYEFFLLQGENIVILYVQRIFHEIYNLDQFVVGNLVSAFVQKPQISCYGFLRGKQITGKYLFIMGAQLLFRIELHIVYVLYENDIRSD